MTVWICDWTHWQGVTLPAAEIEAEGFGMVKLKVGGASVQGRHFEDPKFLESASALLSTRMLPAAYWYLMPGRPVSQAGLFYDMLVATNSFGSWNCFVDLEQPGVTDRDFVDFVNAWSRLAPGKRLAVYTSKRFWLSAMNGLRGASLCRTLEDARWVPESVRRDVSRPYASQQAKAIPAEWWNDQWGGWFGPSIIQFTDYALVDGKRTTASVYRGSKSELQGLFI